MSSAPEPDLPPQASHPVPLPEEQIAPQPERSGSDHEQLDWRRVHRATPFIRGWIVLVALAYGLLQSFGQNGTTEIFEDGISGTFLLITLGSVVVIAGLWVLYGWFAWRRMAYAFDFESVYMRWGIVFRQEQKLRLDRVQSVDIAKPLIARLVGLAELRVTSAAPGAFKIGYLSDQDSQQLRNEILARAAGLVTAATVTPGAVSPQDGVPDQVTASAQTPLDNDFAADGDSAQGVPTGSGVLGQAPSPGAVPTPPPHPLLAQEAPERILYQVPPGRTIASAALSFGPMIAVFMVLAMIIMFATGNGSAAFGVIPVLLGVGPLAWNRFVGEYGFTAGTAADGIRVRHGLLETRSQTIPPGRVQAVRLRQGLLWRKLGWWRADLNIAGQEMGQDMAFSGSILLPVGTQTQAIDALWMVLPDLGVENPLEVLQAAMTGKGTDQDFTVSPSNAKWLDPLSFRRNGYRVLGRALLIRKGFFTRVIEVVPHERTQSLGLKQGPLQRKLGLTSFTLHSTTGMISPSVPHLSNADAAVLLAHQNERATIARHGQGPEKWMEQISGH